MFRVQESGIRLTSDAYDTPLARVREGSLMRDITDLTKLLVLINTAH
jgi:hypothetical protein